jgi:hypothetical protein
MPKVEDSAQVSSCLLKFDHVLHLPALPILGYATQIEMVLLVDCGQGKPGVRNSIVIPLIQLTVLPTNFIIKQVD